MLILEGGLDRPPSKRPPKGPVSSADWTLNSTDRVNYVRTPEDAAPSSLRREDLQK